VDRRIEEALDARRRIEIETFDLFHVNGFMLGDMVEKVIREEPWYKEQLPEGFRPARHAVLKRVVEALVLPQIEETVTLAETWSGDNGCRAASVENIPMEEWAAAGEPFPQLTPASLKVSVDAILAVARAVYDEAHARYRKSPEYLERRTKSKRGMAKGALTQQEYLLWARLDEKIEKHQLSV
jgi:hypothetical protein